MILNYDEWNRNYSKNDRTRVFLFGSQIPNFKIIAQLT
jgi:hypothetical protein